MGLLDKDQVYGLFDTVQRIAKIGSWELDVERKEFDWSKEVYSIHGLPVGSRISLAKALGFYHPDGKVIFQNAIDLALSRGEEFCEELLLVNTHGAELWVQVTGLPTVENGKVVSIKGFFQNIDDAKRAEDRIQTDQLIVKMALDAGKIGIWHWDSITGCLEWNDSMHEIFDWPKSHFKGEYNDFNDRLHPDDEERVSVAVGNAIEGVEKLDTDYRILTRDGRIRYITSTADMKKGITPGAVSMVGVCIDLTETKEGYARERALRNQLKLFIERTPAAVAMLDKDLNFLMASDLWRKGYEVSKEDISGHRFNEFMTSTEKEKTWEKVFRKGLKGKVLSSDAHLFELENGRKQWLKYEVYPWYDQNDKIGGVGMFKEDITLKKEYEDRLLESQEKFRAVIENAAIGMLLTDVKGVFFQVNQAFCQMLGYTKEEVLNLSFKEITSEGENDHDLEEVTDMIDGKRDTFQMERQYKDKNGKIVWVFLAVSIVRDVKNMPSFFIYQVQDITKNKEAESRIMAVNEILESKVAERTEQLEQMNKELESFSYSVSHDLRAPLRIIDGFSRMLQEDYSELLDEEGEDTINSIVSNVKKMSLLIDSLLTFSRMSRKVAERMEIDTVELIEEVIEEIRFAVGLSEFEFQISATLPKIYGDRPLLKQVFFNVIDNAIKYSRKEKKPVIFIGEHKAEDHSTIFIKDNGVGFDMKYYDKLFGVFQRLHVYEEFEGTGVGLALAKKIIEKHDGHISAYAEVEKGATFFIYLPGSTDLKDLSK